MIMRRLAQFMRLCASVCVCLRMLAGTGSVHANARVCVRLCASACECSRLCASVCVCLRMLAGTGSVHANACICLASVCVCVRLCRVCLHLCASACECSRLCASVSRRLIWPALFVSSRVVRLVSRLLTSKVPNSHVGRLVSRRPRVIPRLRPALLSYVGRLISRLSRSFWLVLFVPSFDPF